MGVRFRALWVGAYICGGFRFAGLSRGAYWRMRSVHRSVRLPLTTRRRTPTSFSVYVTRPADCAPRIIVTRIAVSRSARALRPAFISRSSRPKLPHQKRSAEAVLSPCWRRSLAMASSAVHHEATGTGHQLNIERPEDTNASPGTKSTFKRYETARAMTKQKIQPACRTTWDDVVPAMPGTSVNDDSLPPKTRSQEIDGLNPSALAMTA